MGKALSWGEKGILAWNVVCIPSPLGNRRVRWKFPVMTDKMTFSWVNLKLFEEFHVIKGVSKAKYSLNSIRIQGIGNN